MDEQNRTDGGRPKRQTAGSRTSANRAGAGRPAPQRAGDDRISANRSGTDRTAAGRAQTGRTAANRAGADGSAAGRPQTGRTSANRAGADGTTAKRPQAGRTTADRTGKGQTAANRPKSGRPNPNRPDADRRKKKPASKRRRRRNRGLLIFILIILIIGLAGAAFLWKRYSPSKETANLEEYYGIEQEGQVAVIVNNEVVPANGKIIDGEPYIEYSVVRDYLNSRFYWDPNENVMLYTLPKDMISVGVGSKEYSVSKETNSTDYVILKTEGSTAYIALDFIQQYTNLDYKVYEEPNRVMIVSDWGETTVASIKRDTQIRYQAGVKSPVLTEVQKKDQVTVIENEGDWKKVRSEDGFIGYVQKSALRGEKKETTSRPFEEEVFTNISKDYTINLAWHQVTNETANASVLETIANTKGLTTISPTWFHVKNVNGDLESIASTDYVNYAHQSKIEVWAAVRDFDGGIDSFEETYETLSYTSRRDNLTNQLVASALQSGIDGINVDFEKVSEECGEHYIQFIRELSVKCRQNGLVLSVDNYVPQGYTEHFEFKEQGMVADYVIIMGYDEHYGGSPVAGPVASYSFVKDGIEKMLEDVPAEKVINAMPFYTRLWAEVPKTAEELAADEGTDAAAFPMKVTSEALGMAEAETRLAEAGVSAAWDDEKKQDYATWEGSDGVTYEIWLENAASLEEKLKLMKEYKLAGTAAWKLGFEKPEIWDLILRYVN